MNNVEKIIEENLSHGVIGKYALIKKPITLLLKRLLYTSRINEFIDKHSNPDERQFLTELFDDLNFSYLISNRDLQKIPNEGRVICIANHPIGSLDALSLLKAFLDVRRDVKIVVNELLYGIDKLQGLFIPVKLDNSGFNKESVNAIQQALLADNAVIIFPAAEVSRLKGINITDSEWHKGAAHFAKNFQAPILPVYIEARNSILFYLVSILSKKLSMFLLVHELFNKRNKIIRIKIGDVIPAKIFSAGLIETKHHIKLLKKHVHLIGKGKNGIYLTEKNVIHPGDRRIIRRELNNVLMLGWARDGMRIFLTSKSESPESLYEIARLREITFRKVGEGTGKKLDLDKFDDHYQHLIVWDEKELEIVGSYRLGLGNQIIEKKGIDGFYTSTLFGFSNKLQKDFLPSSVELGRSFVQKKYWNSNALSYLWQGIGAYLIHNPSIRYLFGGVSISNNYPIPVQQQIVYYFSKWYRFPTQLAESKRKFVIPEKINNELTLQFNSGNAKDDYKILKNMLKPIGYTVPVLYKHYSDLCIEGGVKFLDFSIDPDFENCIDGLILVDVNMIKEEKRQKFMRPNHITSLKASA